jgi:hypothetical protein
MAQDLFHYDTMVEAALRGVVRDALARVARDGLPGAHHFYIGFATTAPGVVIPDRLREKYPEEMTIVLQHQFSGLDVRPDAVSVTLSFQGRAERLTIPFAAIVSFADPSVEFGLQFQPAPVPAEAAAAAEPQALPAPAADGEKRQQAEIVALDKFRKR